MERVCATAFALYFPVNEAPLLPLPSSGDGGGDEGVAWGKLQDTAFLIQYAFIRHLAGCDEGETGPRPREIRITPMTLALSFTQIFSLKHKLSKEGNFQNKFNKVVQVFNLN